jgi:hypothetical protein
LSRGTDPGSSSPRLSPGAIAHDLRPLGYLLDELNAERFEVEVEVALRIRVTWAADSGLRHRSFERPRLFELAQDLARHRRRDAGYPNTGFEEQLRVLGQQLDTRGMEVSLIVREAGGFRVRGRISGRSSALWFLGLELLHESRTYQLLRERPPAVDLPLETRSIPWWRRPFQRR